MASLMLDETTKNLVEAARTAVPTPTLARRLVGLIDLTALNVDDTTDTIADLCRQAITPQGPVAAVCVLPSFVRQAKAVLGGTGVKVATVIDFPQGNGSPEAVLRESEAALREGADEIDLVFPYARFLSESPPPASRNIRAAREAVGYDVRIKVILETSAYPSFESLAAAAEVAIQAGADFLKTSTGKTPAGATLESAAILLSAIEASGLPVGFKASGGIREVADAVAYLALADSMLGDGWATPGTFRIGASALLPRLLDRI